MQNRSRCGFVEAASRRHGIITLKAAAYAAARVRCTRPCAGAQSFENIEPCKISASEILFEAAGGFNAIFLSGQAR